MKKRIAALVLAASASIAMANANTEKVFAQELNKNQTAPQTEKNMSISKTAQKAKVINVSTNLRVRASASTSAKIVGTLNPGAVVNIQSKSGSWYKIEYNGIIGYSHGDFLQPLSSGNDNNENVSGKVGQVINVSTSLRVRSSASTSSSIIGYLYANEKVDIISSTGSWYKIKHDGKIGYVHKDYLKVVGEGSTDTNKPIPPVTTPEVTPQNKKGQVINVSTSLRIRSSASTSSSIVGHLKANDKVDIIGSSGSWYKIKSGGTTGFVHSDYLKVLGDVNTDTNKPVPPVTTPEVTPDSGKGEVINVSTNLRVRSTPSTSGAIVGYLTSGNIVDIQGKSGSWYKISYSGKVGFVHSDYIKKVNGNTGGNSGENTGGTEVTNKYDKVLQIMKAHVGTPYIYGGSGEEITTSSLNTLKNRFPDHAAKGSYDIESKYINSGYRAFDCSGLMQWSFKQVGINLGRTTTNQVNNGYEVSPNAAKPGDLLFFSNLGHVGMYIGNGQWIESPKPGQPVRIANVPWNLIGRARRVL
ncbi:MAG: SH3 domain-containing protein [Sarcina sp.]